MKPVLIILIAFSFIILSESYSQQQGVWEEITTPQDDNHWIGFITIIGDRLYVGSSGQIFYTDDYGKKWSEIPHPEGTNDIRNIQFIKGRLLINDDGYKNYISSDTGKSWVKFRSPSLPIYYENNLYDIYDYILRSSDFGKTWDTLSKFPLSIRSAEERIIDSKGVFIARDYNGNLVRSTDKGITWKIESKESYQFLTSLGDYVFGYNLRDYKLYRSGNSGVSWEVTSIEKISQLDLKKFNNKGGIIAANKYALKQKLPPIAISNDYGQTWSRIDKLTPIADSTFYAMEYDIDNKTLYLSNNRLFRLKADFKGVNETAVQLYDVSLFPNYISDNSLSRLNFKLDNVSNVRIELINCLGKEIELLKQGKLEPGDYTINIPVELLSGMYYVITEINGKRKTEKLIIER